MSQTNAADAERLALAEAWIAQDPDPETRAELAALVERHEAGDAAASAELADRFDAAPRLRHRRAPRRDRRRPQPHEPRARVAGRGRPRRLPARARRARRDAVGRDRLRRPQELAPCSPATRPRSWPAPACAPCCCRGCCRRPCSRSPCGTSTPSAGVMVTASHNPPNDNGYKVYLGGDDHGSQIVAPADAEIAAHDRCASPRSTTVPELPRGAFETAAESVVDEYVRRDRAVAERADRAQPRVVYTAMHGVGWETAARVFAAAGFDAPALVSAQIAPDPAFPTVAFPNPEEPGAMDLSFERGPRGRRRARHRERPRRRPAGDRDPRCLEPPSGYRRLSGNEVGLLLGWRAARRAADVPGDSGPNGALACSIVSSPGLEAVARAYDLDFEATLTGFKWISRAPGLVFGFEEALGYLVNPETVRDKDGISAAVAFLSLAARAEGRRPHDRRPPRRVRRAVRMLRLGADLAARHRPRRASARSWRDCAPSRRRRSAASASSASRTSPTASAPCRRPTCCASCSRAAPASWCDRAAPSRSSRSTSTPWAHEGTRRRAPRRGIRCRRRTRGGHARAHRLTQASASSSRLRAGVSPSEASSFVADLLDVEVVHDLDDLGETAPDRRANGVGELRRREDHLRVGRGGRDAREVAGARRRRSRPRRSSARSAFTFRIADVPMPAPQTATILMRRPRRRTVGGCAVGVDAEQAAHLVGGRRARDAGRRCRCR